MILKQYYLGCLAHVSYLIADEATRIAAVVDPQRDVDQYLYDAVRLDLRIQHVFLTHLHADFVAGHIELRDRCGARIHLGASATAGYEFTPARDGGRLEFGGVRLEVLETPGHAPEAICLLLYDLARDPSNPCAVLTGDTLFIGDVGRPSPRPCAGVAPEQAARSLFASLHNKLLALPDDTLVYPAHGAGSTCGQNLSTDTVSTIGMQRRCNHALQPMTEDEFVRLVTSSRAESAPLPGGAAFGDQKGPARGDAEEHVLRPLALDEVLRMRNAGAQVLDVREPADFAGAHLVDALNMALAGKFSLWAQAILQRDRPILIISEPGFEEEAATRLGEAGFELIAGFLEGGMQVLESRPDIVWWTDRMTALTLAERLASDDPPLVLDVRPAAEWAEKRIEGSLNIPLDRLAERVHEFPRDHKIVVFCDTGYCSSVAASLLQQCGLSGVTHLVGGLDAWETAKLRTAASSPAQT